MAVLNGNITGTLNLKGFTLPSRIVSFSLVNRDASSISVTVYVVHERESNMALAITPVTVTLAPGQAYIRDAPIETKSYTHLRIVSTGSVDYYFTCDVPFDTLFKK
jgi:hypothetical protein